MTFVRNDCVACGHNEFECRTALCIPEDYRCDGDNDCEDFSDEQNCGQLYLYLPHSLTTSPVSRRARGINKLKTRGTTPKNRETHLFLGQKIKSQ